METDESIVMTILCGAVMAICGIYCMALGSINKNTLVWMGGSVFLALGVFFIVVTPYEFAG